LSNLNLVAFFTNNALTMRRSVKNNNHRFIWFRKELLAET